MFVHPTVPRAEERHIMVVPFEPLAAMGEHRWRAMMGDEAWYQSISDYEEENYFNAPHLQHPRHGDSKPAQDTIMTYAPVQQEHAWSQEPEPEEEEQDEEEEEIFADIDITRDLDALVKAPLAFPDLQPLEPLPPPGWSTSPTPLAARHQHRLERMRKSLPSSPMRSAPSFGASSPMSLSSLSSSSSSASSRSPSAGAVDERAAKDEFLVSARREGMTYRDIKRQGGFTEAESTLRGRYRMLTKSREERVRSPKWTPVDVVLLRKAVLRYCNGRDPVVVKIPWKEIARSISENGGSYLFGNATCRKKWDELASFGVEEVEDEEAGEAQ